MTIHAHVHVHVGRSINDIHNVHVHVHVCMVNLSLHSCNSIMGAYATCAYMYVHETSSTSVPQLFRYDSNLIIFFATCISNTSLSTVPFTLIHMQF